MRGKSKAALSQTPPRNKGRRREKPKTVYVRGVPVRTIPSHLLESWMRNGKFIPEEEGYAKAELARRHAVKPSDMRGQGRHRSYLAKWRTRKG